MNKLYFTSKDGTKLCGIWHKPKVKTSKAIVLAHGMKVNKDEEGVFVTLADLLMQNGYAVFRFDFRGHGESEGKSIDLTLSGKVLDIYAAIDLVQKEYSEVGLLGASFGGGSTTLFASRYQDSIKCLCLWNPVLNYDHCYLHPTLPKIVARKGHLAKEIAEKGWTSWGSNNFVIGKALWQEMEQHQPFEDLKNINTPTLIIHGSKDTLVPYEDSVAYVDNLPNGSLTTIEGAEHGFHQPWESEIACQITLKFFQDNV